jgi:drug/metabolite transporter (DMT)-like permease
MLLWLLFALAAPALWAVSNLIDQRLLKEEFADPLGLLVLTGLFSLVPLFVVASLGGLAWPGTASAAMALVAGSLGLLVYFPYFLALRDAPTTEVVMLWNFAPVFIVVAAWCFLGERLGPTEYVAIALLVLSTSIATGTSRLRWRRTVPLMMMASVLLAMESVLAKAVFERVSFQNGLAWISLGAVLTALVLLLLARPHRWPRDRGVLWLVSANQLLDVGAAAALSFAISKGPVSVVKAVGGLQPVFVLLIGARLGGRAAYVRAFVAALLAILGLALVRSTL